MLERFRQFWTGVWAPLGNLLLRWGVSPNTVTVVGTLGGASVRGALGKAFGKDLPAALIEDAVALLGAIFIVSRV